MIINQCKNYATAQLPEDKHLERQIIMWFNDNYGILNNDWGIKREERHGYFNYFYMTLEMCVTFKLRWG